MVQVSQKISSKDSVCQKRKKTMILKNILEIFETKKNRILENHNAKVDHQFEKLNDCNILAKIMQLFIKSL